MQLEIEVISKQIYYLTQLMESPLTSLRVYIELLEELKICLDYCQTEEILLPYYIWSKAVNLL